MVVEVAEKKVCAKCKEELPIEQFAFKAKGKRHSYCKECNGEYHKQHYETYRAHYIEKAKRNNVRVLATGRALLLTHLKTHPCVDCGEADIVVLEFDHVRGDKLFNLTDVRAWKKYRSLQSIEDEIAKCDVRCANCHRRRHAAERGWHKFNSEQWPSG